MPGVWYPSTSLRSELNCIWREHRPQSVLCSSPVTGFGQVRWGVCTDHGTQNMNHESPRRKFLHQCLAFSEPRPLAPLHVPRQCALFRQQLLRPLARLFAPVRRLQKTRVVVQRLRSRRYLRHFREKLLRAFQLTRSCVRIRVQSRGSNRTSNISMQE